MENTGERQVHSCWFHWNAFCANKAVVLTTYLCRVFTFWVVSISIFTQVSTFSSSIFFISKNSHAFVAVSLTLHVWPLKGKEHCRFNSNTRPSEWSFHAIMKWPFGRNVDVSTVLTKGHSPSLPFLWERQKLLGVSSTGSHHQPSSSCLCAAPFRIICHVCIWPRQSFVKVGVLDCSLPATSDTNWRLASKNNPSQTVRFIDTVGFNLTLPLC